MTEPFLTPSKKQCRNRVTVCGATPISCPPHVRDFRVLKEAAVVIPKTLSPLPKHLKFSKLLKLLIIAAPRLNVVNFFNPAFVTTAFKRGRKENFEPLFRVFESGESAAENDDVCIVVLP